jgi:hypothetical protein
MSYHVMSTFATKQFTFRLTLVAHGIHSHRCMYVCRREMKGGLVVVHVFESSESHYDWFAVLSVELGKS